jgi:IS30 family transposase
MIYSGGKNTDVAKLLDRDRSTLHRELNRNKTKGYNAANAHDLARERRPVKTRKLESNIFLRFMVMEMLECYYSPELIAHTLKELFPDDETMNISHESIYAWIYAQKDVRIKKRISSFLFCHKRKRQKRGNTYKTRGKDPLKKNIKDRPCEANDRTEVGHLEGDLVVSTGKDAYLLTLVDRKTSFTWAVTLPSKDAALVTRAIVEALEDTPSGFVKTITFDNGTEFSLHQDIEHALQCLVYFADPYSSWQRGLNEHINGRIRQFLPKKKSFVDLTDDALISILSIINGRPRKSRGWISPADLISYHFCCA